MTQPTDGERAVRRARIETALAGYPAIERERLDEVLHWFRKEASALDVALLASNQEIREVYRRFRTDHLDGITRGDLVSGLAIAVALAVVVAAIAWLSF